MNYRILLLFLCLPLYSFTQNDSLALVQFYQDMEGEDWTNQWDFSKPIKSWYGLDVTAGNRVYGISLNDNNLKGSLSESILQLTEMRNFAISEDSIWGTIPDSIHLLKKLQYFYCAHTQVSGSIPSKMGELPDVTNIYLISNQLTDTLPSSLANLDQLFDFDVRGNQLKGVIPAGMGNNPMLRSFRISNNDFEGAVPIDLKNATELKHLDLFGNRLEDFPVDLMVNMTKLELANLGNNQFSGPFPNLPDSIESFGCADNRFTGEIPNSVKDLINLSSLDIRRNCFTGIPDFTGHPSLQFLDVGGNQLTFTDVLPNIGLTQYYTYNDMKPVGKDTTVYVPFGSDYEHRFAIDTSINNKTFLFFKDGISGMTNANGILEFSSFSASDTGTYHVEITHPDAPDLTLTSYKLRLRTNINQDSLALVRFYQEMDGDNWINQWDFSQPVDTWTGVTLKDQRISELYLYDNHLKGSLSTAFLALPELKEITLGNDSIWGTLPDSIFLLKKLQSINITSTQLSGAIPVSIGDLQEMSRINLSINNLNEPLPNSLSKLSKLTFFKVSQNQIPGEIPPDMGVMPGLRIFHIGANLIEGAVPSGFKHATAMVEMNLYQNKLTTLPVDLLVSMDKLNRIELADNEFKGSLPSLPANVFYLGCSNNQFSGKVPSAYVDLQNLGALILQNNYLSEIPDFNNHPELKTLNIYGNQFTFEDVLPNIGSVEFYRYYNMKTVGTDTTIGVQLGSMFSHQFAIDTSITNKTFLFFKDGVSWMSNTTGILEFSNFSVSDTGTYHVEITHPDAPDLTLESYRVILTTNITTSTQVSTPDLDIKIYPNPVADFLHLKRSISTPVEIEIYNLLGRSFLKRTLKEEGGVPVDNLLPGVYFIRIKDEAFAKFIKN